jgi:23S rRNA (pseudouridine1915-N3)-methyltransferase
MRLRIIWIGKTKDAHLRALIEEYLKRLSHFVRCEVSELRDSGSEGKMGIEKDSKRILDALPSGSLTVLLDREGSEWSSEELAGQMRQWSDAAVKEVTFIIGGPLGVSKELSARVDKRWSLSRLTFTHELARVLLLEQLYRAHTIIHGLPYQK